MYAILSETASKNRPNLQDGTNIFISEATFHLRDLLAEEPDILAEYNALKTQFEGGDMNAYREIKGKFIERILDSRRSTLP